jgi:hypothetical protein
VRPLGAAEAEVAHGEPLRGSRAGGVSPVIRKTGGASGGGSEKSTALADYNSGEDTPGTGVAAILQVEDDLRRDRENREALVDALLVQEILSSVIHYFAAALSKEERQAIIDLIVDAIIDCDLNYGEKAAIKWGDGFKWRQETPPTARYRSIEQGEGGTIESRVRKCAYEEGRARDTAGQTSLCQVQEVSSRARVVR